MINNLKCIDCMIVWYVYYNNNKMIEITEIL